MRLSIDFQKTALHFAIKESNIDIVRLLLNRPEIDVNIPYSISRNRGKNKTILKWIYSKNTITNSDWKQKYRNRQIFAKTTKNQYDF